MPNFTEAQEKEIFTTNNVAALARTLGVSKPTLHNIRRGKYRKHLFEKYHQLLKPRESSSKVLKEDRDAIKASGLTNKELAEKYGLSESMVSRVKSGKRWKS